VTGYGERRSHSRKGLDELSSRRTRLHFDISFSFAGDTIRRLPLTVEINTLLCDRTRYTITLEATDRTLTLQSLSSTWSKSTPIWSGSAGEADMVACQESELKIMQVRLFST